MDILRDIPVRTDAIEEEATNNKRTRDEACDTDADDDDKKRRKKSVSIDDQGRSLKLGLNLRDDYIEVDEIQERPVPREDGYEWSFWEKTTEAESKRPYNKAYMADQEARQKILSNNKDYRFMTELAGALRKELSDIVDPEDMSRLAEERETRRLQTAIELQRTRVDMDKKYDLVQKLKQMVRDEEQTFNAIRADEPPYALTLLSRYIIDTKSIPSSFSGEYYGFLDLVNLVKAFAPVVSDATRTALINDVLESEEVDALGSNDEGSRKDLFFYLYTYFHTFLDNEKGYDLRESLERKIAYARENYSTLTGEILSEIKKEPAQSSTTTTSTTTNITDSRVIDQPLNALDEFYDRISTATVDWARYREQRTETIDMDFFDRLRIARATERRMAEIGLASNETYLEEAPIYTRSIITFLYGNEQERSNIPGGDNSFDIMSGDPRTGGNPRAIDTLIRIQYPRYDENDADGPSQDAVAEIVRSHLLYLYFVETPWPEIVTLLTPEQEKIIRNIRAVQEPVRALLDGTLVIYKGLLFYYFRQVAQALYKHRPRLIALPPAVELLLLSENTQPDNIRAAAVFFDELNRLLTGVELRDIIIDNFFYEFLATGNDAFAVRRFYEDLPSSRSSSVSATPIGDKPTNLIIDREYPALLLHDLLRKYNDYTKEYLLTSTENLARLNAAIQKANKKIAEVVGDESYTLSRPSDYTQRKSFVSKIENSGFTKMRAEIQHLLKQTYFYVMDYAPNLCGLPLDAFMTDSANESGLSTYFIDVAAVLSANREFTFNEGYRTQMQLIKIQLDKQGSMARMRRFIWSGSPQRGYVIARHVEIRPNLSVCSGPGPVARCYQRPSRIMF